MSSAKIGVAIATTGVMCLSLGFVAAQIDGGSNASGPKSVQTAILDDPQFLAQGGSESEIILLADVSAPKSAAPVDPASPQTGAPETKPGGPLDANAPSNQQSVRQTAVKAKFADRPLSRSTGGILNYRQRSSAEQKVEAALEQVSPVQFKETPLHDVVQFLSEFHHIPILIDLQHVSESGVALDMPVTISLDDLPLVNVLDLILEDLALTYVVEHGVLRITSQEHASNRMETVLYELRHIESAGMGPDDIYRVLSTTLADEWTENAGPGSLDVIPGAIVVRASQKTHREIANFLKQLEQFAERNDLGPPTPLPPRQRPPDGAAGGGFWSM